MEKVKWKNPIANKPFWSNHIQNKEAKQEVAKQVANRVREGDVIGIGSGSTSILAIQEVSKRMIEENLNITAIPTSREAELACCALSIPVTTLGCRRPDWAFDGADEVDPASNLIKGRGGAMFMEKLVISSAKEAYILVDESKFVDRLGSKFPIPIEVDPRAVNLVETECEKYNAMNISLRPATGKDGPVYTEAGNVILDVTFEEVPDSLEKDLAAIPGVIETGLFIGYHVEVLSTNS